MSGVGRGVRTLHQYHRLRQRQITSLISRALRPHPLRRVLPRPLMAITIAGNTRTHTNPTAPAAITLPLTFLPNIILKGLLITPFSRAFIAASAYRPDFHPFSISYSPPRSVSQMSQALASSTTAPRPFVCEDCGMNFSRQHGSFFLGLSDFTLT
jgi:hypothetical protein